MSEEERPVFRRTETAQTWLMLALVGLGGLTVAMISDRLGRPGFAVLLLLAVALLLTHSLSVRVDARRIEVRLGNGIVRGSRDLSQLRDVRASEGEAVVGLGRRVDGVRTFGLGGDEVVWLTFEDGASWRIAMHDATRLTLELRARLRRTADESGPDTAPERT